MNGLERTAGVAVAIAAVAGLAWMSQVPLSFGAGDQGLLRVAWRARPERVEHCVTQSPEALASLPAHMRETTICEGINASYRLEVRHNGVLVTERLVEPGGLRRDRPLYVFEEIEIPAEMATIRISFERVEVAGADGDAAAVDRGILREAVPSSLAWEKRLPFAPGQVRIVSYDPGQQALFEVLQD